MKAEMTEIVMPNDTNPMGTVFGGKIMAWIDMVAAVAAQRAVGSVVTASVDSIEFEKPIKVGDIITLKAIVNKIWNSSLEIGVQVLYQRQSLVDIRIEEFLKGAISYSTLELPIQACHAFLTFVAVDKNGNRRIIDKNNIKLSQEPEWQQRAEEAEQRRTFRLVNRKKKI